jgi:hypothetical protein
MPSPSRGTEKPAVLHIFSDQNSSFAFSVDLCALPDKALPLRAGRDLAQNRSVPRREALHGLKAKHRATRGTTFGTTF